MKKPIIEEPDDFYTEPKEEQKSHINIEDPPEEIFIRKKPVDDPFFGKIFYAPVETLRKTPNKLQEASGILDQFKVNCLDIAVIVIPFEDGEITEEQFWDDTYELINDNVTIFQAFLWYMNELYTHRVTSNKFFDFIQFYQEPYPSYEELFNTFRSSIRNIIETNDLNEIVKNGIEYVRSYQAMRMISS